MHTVKQAPSWKTPSGYAASHCRNCESGWTRTGTEGGEVTVCLIDRQPVLANMIKCDRFERRMKT